MVTIIAALTQNGVIGNNNAIPWRIPEERQLFHRVTNGHTVLMGRRTFESIGRPLPKRQNIVITSSLSPRPGISVASSITSALQSAVHGDIYIIGGGQIYAQTLSLADRLQLSYIKGRYGGDVFFPEFEQKHWCIAARQEYKQFTHITYVKRI